LGRKKAPISDPSLKICGVRGGGSDGGGKEKKDASVHTKKPEIAEKRHKANGPRPVPRG